MSNDNLGYFDVKYKIMVLGESKVGKTSLIRRYTKNVFGGVYLTTVGMDFQDKIIDIEDKKVRLQIWDTAGQERFRNVTKSYFQSSYGFLLVYDITDKESLEKTNFWMGQIKLNGPERAKSILIGNKCDLINERQVSIGEGKKYAERYDIKFFETSAKDETNVNDSFFYLANEIYQNDILKGKEEKKLKLENATKNQKVKKKCC